MRKAIASVLADPSCSEAARAIDTQLAGIHGAVNGAAEIERMLPATLRKAF